MVLCLVEHVAIGRRAAGVAQGWHDGGPGAIAELEIPQLVRQAHEHAQLLVSDIEVREAGLLLIALLRLHDEAVHVVGRTPDLQRQAVFFVLREVVQVAVQLPHHLHKAPIQIGFRVQAHRYRSGPQRYEAARKPTLTLEFARALFQLTAQTPAPDPALQLPPASRHSSLRTY